VLWKGLPRAVQVVYRRAPLPVEEIELDPRQDAVAQLNARMGAGQLRMDLQTAPLIRAEIAREPGSLRWYALLQIHHLVDDVTSQRILHEEVLAHLRGQADQLPEPVAYRRFVAHALAQADRKDALAYFTDRLATLEGVTAPFGLTDVHGDGSDIEEARRVVEPALARRLRKHAGRRSVSVAALFHAAWGLLVARASGRDDIAFGTVLLGRLQDVAGADRALGMFINTLPIRLRLAGLTASDLVETTHREVVDLLRYEQTPLVLAQQCSGVPAPAPLFTAILNYRHSRTDQWDTAARTGTAASGVDALTRQERTNYPFTLCVDDTDETFLLTALTDRRIDPRRVADYLYTTLESLADALDGAPETPALALEVLPEDERRRQLDEFNPARTEYPGDRLLHELFEEQVERRPAATALVYEDRQLSYDELNRRANRVAHYLRGLGIGPDTVVALALPRSPELIIALLAVLKAGAAYLPVDLGYPADRVAYMFDDARPAATLTLRELADQLPDATGPRILLDDPGPYATAPAGNPAGVATADDLAYVIYTSGSTGRPKGTLLTHRGLSNVAEAQQRILDLDDAPRVLQFASISFDAATFEIVMAWRNGGILCMGSSDGLMPGRPLADLLNRHQVSAVTLTPSALAALPDGEFPHLRTICVAGEACPAELVDRWAPGRRFFNLYGPTETTIWATWHRCEQKRGRPPIGRPIPNVRAYVLDAHRRLVPVGAVGELYLGGVGIARGYLRQPELTAGRFVVDPFAGADTDARVYRTGDQARWRADGTLEFLGRDDHQVKIRGFRVELGEIEAQIAADPLVHEVVVIAREDLPGDRRLVAYVVPTRAEQPAPAPDGAAAGLAAHLRAALEATVPNYMVPGDIVVLDALPQTPNGKVDRNALPAPDLSARAGRGEAPQGPAEELIAAASLDILQLERIGRDDDFFGLGGHSLLATQLTARLREIFDVDLPLREFFDSPTVAGIARLLAERCGGWTELEGLATTYIAISSLSDDEVQRLLSDGGEPA
jgi:amino acid adenylation domain-containing protein